MYAGKYDKKSRILAFLSLCFHLYPRAMVKLSRKLEYTLMALQYMARQPEGALVTAKEISQRYEAPFEVVARCLQKLAGQGLVRSVAGASGGYQLTSKWSKVTLLELFEVIEGKAQMVRCIDGQESCEYIKKCDLVDPIARINGQMRSFYNQIQVSQVLGVQSSKKEILA